MIRNASKASKAAPYEPARTGGQVDSPRQPRTSQHARTGNLTQPKAAPFEPARTDGQVDKAQAAPDTPARTVGQVDTAHGNLDPASAHGRPSSQPKAAPSGNPSSRP